MQTKTMTWSTPAAEVEATSAVIRAAWPGLVRENRESGRVRLCAPGTPEDSEAYRNAPQMELLGLPRPYVIPATDAFEAMFYWDSWFTMLGLVEDGHLELARGMVENCLHMQREYGHIPNASAPLWLNNVSQPPFLTSMIRLVHGKTGDRAWLDGAMATAEAEYRDFWLAESHHPRGAEWAGLARWHSADDTIFWSEAESGWDFTPRFGDARRCIAIDLNCLLFRYEQDFAWWRELAGDAPGAARWRGAMEARRAATTRLLWDEAEGLFFDYDVVEGARRPVRSIAAYYALWSGLATPAQAARLAASLPLFERAYGLACCDRDYAELPSLLEFEGAILPNGRKQWNTPNGWAPLTWLAVRGLLDCGHEADARRLADKWIALVVKVRAETGRIWEKYNVEEGSINTVGRYGVHPGFGWTNAVFQALRGAFEG